MVSRGQQATGAFQSSAGQGFHANVGSQLDSDTVRAILHSSDTEIRHAAGSGNRRIPAGERTYADRSGHHCPGSGSPGDHAGHVTTRDHRPVTPDHSDFCQIVRIAGYAVASPIDCAKPGAEGGDVASDTETDEPYDPTSCRR